MGYLPELVDSVILPGFDEREMSVTTCHLSFIFPL